MAKLSDTQLLILSKASQREDGAVELPPDLPGDAAKKVTHSLVKRGFLEEVPAKRKMPVWREVDGEGRALIITPTGLQAIGVETAQQEETAAKPRGGGDKGRKRSTRTEAVGGAANERQSLSSAPHARGGKQALVISLLGRKQGARLTDMVAATGWLPHTTRAVLSGLRKQGYRIDRSRSEDGASVYRLIAKAA